MAQSMCSSGDCWRRRHRRRGVARIRRQAQNAGRADAV
jgi:hypothetical protein